MNIADFWDVSTGILQLVTDISGEALLPLSSELRLKTVVPSEMLLTNCHYALLHTPGDILLAIRRSSIIDNTKHY